MAYVWFLKAYKAQLVGSMSTKMRKMKIWNLKLSHENSSFFFLHHVSYKNVHG
jgi:hypothetical protein